MDKDVEKDVRDFYDHHGWKVGTSGASGEDVLFRKFCAPYYPYHENVNARTMGCFSGLSGRLLIAGGGDLPETHVAIAQQFSSTTCLDISSRALEIAKQKLGQNGEYVHGSILEIPRPAGHFDAAYCAHVIYHIDRQLQEQAVRELIRAIKPGGRIVIIYGNPRALTRRLHKMRLDLGRYGRAVQRRLKPRGEAKAPDDPPAEPKPGLYYFVHPLDWWDRFGDACEVRLLPWDVMGSSQDKALLPSEAIGRFVYRSCSWFESRYPDRAVRLWAYPLVVLTKRAGSGIEHGRAERKEEP